MVNGNKVWIEIVIPYCNIRKLQQELAEDTTLDAEVARPRRAPKNSTDKVVIKMMAIVQGQHHHDTLVERIVFHEGKITDTKFLGKFPKRDRIKSYFKRSWIPLTFGAAGATIEEVLRYWHLIFSNQFDYVPSLIFVLLVVAGIGVGHLSFFKR